MPIRVLLIYPPAQTQIHYKCPSGIMMLAAVLEREGYQVSLLDANAARKRRSSDEILQYVAKLQPDVIGMTLLTTFVKEAYDLTALLRQKGIKLLAGGPHASLMPEETIEHGFDAAVIGEGEPTIKEAIQALTGQMPMGEVKGWVYKDVNGLTQRTAPSPLVEDLDSLPFAARHLVNPLDYGSAKNLALQNAVLSSRGCPGRCSYCCGSLFGKSFRFRSAANVIAEMKDMNNKYGTTQFHFVDDAMTMNQLRMREICQGLIDAKMNITWNMMTRIDSVNEELLSLAVQAGCRQIEYGIESGNAVTLRNIRKPHTIEMVRRIIPLTARLGIRPQVFFIFGFPWEGPKEIQNTLSFMKELAPYVDCFHPAGGCIIVPFPGTEIYEHYKQEYEFENWWLIENRRYKAPTLATHSYFECRIFPFGVVLDVDFFHYTSALKREIQHVFKFMYYQNIRNLGFFSNRVRKFLLRFSEILCGLAPSWEKKLFSALIRMVHEV